MEKTRSASKCPIFGECCELKRNSLPTYEDIVKHYEWTRLSMKTSKKEPKFSEIADKIVPEIETKTCDRYGVSDRAAAAIVSSVLHDIGSEVEVIDRSKLRRERTKTRQELLKQEPGSTYLGYVIPHIGSAKGIVSSIIAFLEQQSISKNDLMAIGCDGTNVNTGKNGGPKSYNGPIGKVLENCEELRVIKFQKIEGDMLPDMTDDLKDLKCIVETVIQRNGYFAHSENLLLAMITDERKHIRELAARRILKARSSAVQTPRLFDVPKINFDASNYIDIINWQKEITEAPILKTCRQKKSPILFSLVARVSYHFCVFRAIPKL
ncbi:hypothetical protein EVAR_2278_1 [Eumeta japonica]|uniref:Uncharacterized protein n=1 Tax=Eumeta variegata TaxID=151549 RepID=A0A4C1SG46_EUMVA|nr:hypothetical protein EVAR_2278_1 [Eumeta japonica]